MTYPVISADRPARGPDSLFDGICLSLVLAGSRSPFDLLKRNHPACNRHRILNERTRMTDPVMAHPLPWVGVAVLQATLRSASPCEAAFGPVPAGLRRRFAGAPPAAIILHCVQLLLWTSGPDPAKGAVRAPLETAARGSTPWNPTKGSPAVSLSGMGCLRNPLAKARRLRRRTQRPKRFAAARRRRTTRGQQPCAHMPLSFPHAIRIATWMPQAGYYTRPLPWPLRQIRRRIGPTGQSGLLVAPPQATADNGATPIDSSRTQTDRWTHYAFGKVLNARNPSGVVRRGF